MILRVDVEDPYPCPCPVPNDPWLGFGRLGFNLGLLPVQLNQVVLQDISWFPAVGVLGSRGSTVEGKVVHRK